MSDYSGYAPAAGLICFIDGTPIPSLAGYSVRVQIQTTALVGVAAAKRITVGGNDAQISGTIALYNLERVIREAGYGINSMNLLGCTLNYVTTPGKIPVKIKLAPVTINSGLIPPGDANTDTLLVVYGQSSESADGDPMIAASTQSVYQITTGRAFMVAGKLPSKPRLRAASPERVIKSELSLRPREITTRTVLPVAGLV